MVIPVSEKRRSEALIPKRDSVFTGLLFIGNISQFAADPAVQMIPLPPLLILLLIQHCIKLSEKLQEVTAE